MGLTVWGFSNPINSRFWLANLILWLAVARGGSLCGPLWLSVALCQEQEPGEPRRPQEQTRRNGQGVETRNQNLRGSALNSPFCAALGAHLLDASACSFAAFAVGAARVHV